MKKILLIIALSLGCFAVSAQGIKDIRINEILVLNEDSYADAYAHKVGWIELFNSGYSQVNISAAYFRHIYGNDTVTYRIPKGDTRTNMAPQGYLVFFCDGVADKGTFHTNFRLDADSAQIAANGGKMVLQLLDQSGKNVIDCIEYDVTTQTVDNSYGRVLNDEGELVLAELATVTPMQSNETHERIPKSELFFKEDPSGISMAIVAMSVVFSALLLLYLIFKNVGKLMQSTARKKAERELIAAAPTPAAKVAVAAIPIDEDIDGETVAAIAMALLRYEDNLHDIENTILTINKVAKVYSPWSSKIYSMRQMPNRK